MIQPFDFSTFQTRALNLLANNVTLLSGCKLQLYTNPLTFTRGMGVGLFTPPTFTGYAIHTILAGDWVVRVGVDGVNFISPGDIPFSCTATLGTDVVQGYFVTDPAGTNLLYAGQFPAPVPMQLAGQVCNVDCTLGLLDLLAVVSLGDGD